MNEVVYFIGGGLVLFFILPTTVYLCIKMGTYGFLKAHQIFQNEEKEHGNEAKS